MRSQFNRQSWFSVRSLVAAMLLIAWSPSCLPSSEPIRLLFIGNSFTFGAGTPVQGYHPESVSDLNQTGIGGVPALVAAFTVESHLSYAVSLETRPGKGLDYHLAEKTALIVKPWDVICMHGHSLLDEGHPGNPALLVKSAGSLADLFHDQNHSVKIYLTATWARADQVYLPSGTWYGKGLGAMTGDLRRGYDLAAAADSAILGVIPVGDTWMRAIDHGLAEADPYHPKSPGLIDLWGADYYHASIHGYYLEALTIFAVVTGIDPRNLGDDERVASDLGITHVEAHALQQIAFDQVHVVTPK